MCVVLSLSREAGFAWGPAPAQGSPGEGPNLQSAQYTWFLSTAHNPAKTLDQGFVYQWDFFIQSSEIMVQKAYSCLRPHKLQTLLVILWSDRAQRWLNCMIKRLIRNVLVDCLTGELIFITGFGFRFSRCDSFPAIKALFSDALCAS